jgi:hypothetical protein
MYRSEHEFIVKKPIDVVFKNLSCLRGCVNWSSMMRTAEQLDPGAAGVGVRYKHVASFMGLSSELIQTLRIYNPPYEFAFDDAGTSMLPIENHYILSEVPEGTLVRYIMTLKPRESMIGRMAATLMVGRIQKQMDQDLETFKTMVEADVTVHV